LHHKDFSDLSPAELDLLAGAMAQLRLVTPQRQSRRTFDTPLGSKANLRRTLRLTQGAAKAEAFTFATRLSRGSTANADAFGVSRGGLPFRCEKKSLHPGGGVETIGRIHL